MEQNVQQITFCRDKINTQGFLLLNRMIGLSMILEGGIQIELVGLPRSDTREENKNTKQKHTQPNTKQSTEAQTKQTTLWEIALGQGQCIPVKTSQFRRQELTNKEVK